MQSRLETFGQTPWISSIDRTLVEGALVGLRRLTQPAEAALESSWGPEWPDKLKKMLRLPVRPSLADVRLLLRVLAMNHPDNPVRDRFPLVAPEHAQELKDIANAARHDDASRWNPGDASRAAQIAIAILACVDVPHSLAAAAVAGHHEELFVVESSGRLMHRWYSESEQSWSDWGEMPASPAIAIAAVGAAEQLDLFIVTSDGRVEHRAWYLGRGWDAWRALPQGGQAVVGPLHVSSVRAGHLELFATGETGATVHRWANGSNWSPWHPFDLPRAVCTTKAAAAQ